MSAALLDIGNLGVSIDGDTIIDGLSLRMAPGESVGLVGESGSGKSMTALAVMQLLPRSATLTGDIGFDGRRLAGLADAEMCGIRGRDIGMIFQEPMTALNPLMSIGDQVAETASAHGIHSRSRAREMARAALERVGLGAPRVSPDRFPHQLSGGQRQRVAIAMAVVMTPRLLIADEPTTALDVSTQAGILSLLKRMVREDGSALLLISHDLGVVAHMAGRIVVMQGGRAVEQGRTADVLAAGVHPYTQGLVAASRLRPRRGGSPRPGPAPAAGALLEVRDLVCDHGGVRAVDDVTFRVGPGESVGIVGESGSGKSTLLRAVLGVRSIQGGQIRLDGEVLACARGTRLRRLRRLIQCVFQDPAGSFDPRWRVAQLVAEPLHLLDSAPSPRDRRRKVDALLEKVGLRAADAERFPHELSGGQRQRVAIARALIVEPRLIALDEAVSALDVTTRAQILALLAELSDSMGLGLLFVSHDLAAVRAITDRVIVMERGRVVESGMTTELFDAPQQPYTASLIAATPSF